MSGALPGDRPVRPALTRDELLGGFHGGDRRRAAVALSLIEARAARFAVERGTVRAPFMTENALARRRQAYLGAVVEGARSRNRVSIQNLEGSARTWQALVPDNPAIRADLARRLGERFRFTYRHVPRIVAALGLDESAVQEAYLRVAGNPLARIFREQVSPLERLRWSWSRLNDRVESLSPFWTAFALTITETVGAGTLGLPIALATVGPAGGALLLVLLGLVNLLTVACLAEASARSGSIRYGSAFVGRLVHDYLGAPASILLRVALFVFCCIILVSYYTGFASTLGAVTGLAAPFWVTVICGAGLFLILRKSLVGTLASALVIGAVNISILVVLSLVALSHATRENLLHMQLPLLAGQGFEPSHLQLVFGVVMVSYFGHLSVSNCAQAVLRRDPGGRSLKRGTIAAMAVAIGIYCLWAVSVAGAVGPEALRRETGTALVPLAARIGPGIYVLGVAFAVLGLGMSSIHYGLGIVNMARELTDRFRAGEADSWARRNASTIVALLPVMAVFGYVQWTYLRGTPSFTAPLELLGVLLTPVLAGIFPVLLLLGARAQGLASRGAGLSALASNRAVLAAVVLLSFAGLLLHGLVIWEDAPRRAAALFTAAVMVWLLVDLVRRGAFAPALHIELRHFPEGDDVAQMSVAFAGNPTDRSVRLEHVHGTVSALRPDGLVRGFRALRSLSVELPARRASTILVTALTVSLDHEARPISGRLELRSADGTTRTVELDAANSPTRAAVPAGAVSVQLSFGADGHSVDSTG